MLCHSPESSPRFFSASAAINRSSKSRSVSVKYSRSRRSYSSIVAGPTKIAIVSSPYFSLIWSAIAAVGTSHTHSSSFSFASSSEAFVMAYL